MVRNRDFVILGLQQWEEGTSCSNAKHIATKLAEFGNRVLFVNTPIDRISYMKGDESPSSQKKINVLNNKEQQLQEISSNLWNFYPKIVIESINWIKPSALFDGMNRLNNKKFASEISSVTKELGFKDIILINDNDLFKCFYLKEYLEPDMSVYYIRDFITAVPYWAKHGSRLEPKLIEKSDLVVANSPYYAEYSKQFNEQSHFVGQGCDLGRFDESLFDEVPEDISNIKKPIIGYVGNLTTLRLDIEIIKKIAINRPDWSVVLVGPEDEAFRQSDLHQMDNVHFLGHKPMDILPAYIKQFDVCINPQFISQITIGNYPLKIDEYLAMGKPVVATHTQTMEYFGEHCYLADMPDEYVLLIEKALKENTEEKIKARRAFASSHTWDNNVKAICEAINMTIAEREKYKENTLTA